jgi:hypothetical protein
LLIAASEAAKQRNRAEKEGRDLCRKQLMMEEDLAEKEGEEEAERGTDYEYVYIQPSRRSRSRGRGGPSEV